MTDANVEGLGLRRRLSTRLRPLALAIGVLISLGLPVTYYVLQYNALRREAETSAARLAAFLPGAVDPEAVVRDFTRSIDAVVVRVEGKGPNRAVREVVVVTPLAERWWNRLVPVGTAPVLSAGETIGRTEVCLAQGTLIAITLGLLVMSTVTGVGLAFLVYAVPVRVVGGMEQRVAALVEEISRRGERLRTVAELARAVSGSLELTAVLREVVPRSARCARRSSASCVWRIPSPAAIASRAPAARTRPPWSRSCASAKASRTSWRSRAVRCSSSTRRPTRARPGSIRGRCASSPSTTVCRSRRARRCSAC